MHSEPTIKGLIDGDVSHCDQNITHNHSQYIDELWDSSQDRLASPILLQEYA